MQRQVQMSSLRRTAKAASGELDGMTEQQKKNCAAIALLDEWLADESGYDERVWPVVKKAIEAHRLSERPRFHNVLEE